MAQTPVQVRCPKCGGAGRLPTAQGWGGRAGGRCFTCRGTGTVIADARVERAAAIDRCAAILRDIDAKLGSGIDVGYWIRQAQTLVAQSPWWPGDVVQRFGAALAKRVATAEAAGLLGCAPDVDAEREVAWRKTLAAVGQRDAVQAIASQGRSFLQPFGRFLVDTLTGRVHSGLTMTPQNETQGGRHAAHAAEATS